MPLGGGTRGGAGAGLWDPSYVGLTREQAAAIGRHTGGSAHGGADTLIRRPGPRDWTNLLRGVTSGGRSGEYEGRK